MDAVALSPDGAYVACGGFSGEVAIWDATTGRRVRTLAGRGEPAQADEDGEIRLEPGLHRTEDVPIYVVAFSPDGNRIAAGGTSTTYEVLEMDVANPFRSLTRSMGGEARVWDVATGRQLMSLGGHGRDVVGLAFSRDGARIAGLGLDYRLIVWDAASGERRFEVAPEAPIGGQGGSPIAGQTDFSADALRAASTQTDLFIDDGERRADPFTVKLWDAGADRFVVLDRERLLEGARVHRSALHPDGAPLLLSCSDRTIRVVDFGTGRVVRTIDVPEGRTAGVLEIDPSGERFVSFGRDGSMILWDYERGRPIRAFRGPEEFARAVAFLPGRLRVASGGWGEFVDPETGEERVRDLEIRDFDLPPPDDRGGPRD